MQAHEDCTFLVIYFEVPGERLTSHSTHHLSHYGLLSPLYYDTRFVMVRSSTKAGKYCEHSSS